MILTSLFAVEYFAWSLCGRKFLNSKNRLISGPFDISWKIENNTATTSTWRTWCRHAKWMSGLSGIIPRHWHTPAAATFLLIVFREHLSWSVLRDTEKSSSDPDSLWGCESEEEGSLSGSSVVLDAACSEVASRRRRISCFCLAFYAAIFRTMSCRFPKCSLASGSSLCLKKISIFRDFNQFFSIHINHIKKVHWGLEKYTTLF